MIGDEPAPRKWLHSKSRRSQMTLPVFVSIAAVPGRAERHVDAARLDDGRRRRVGVEGVRVLGRGDLEQLQVVTGSCPQSRSSADREELAAILGGRRDPDLIAQNDGRRPGAAVNRRLPPDVLALAPRQRQIGARRVARSRQDRGTAATARAASRNEAAAWTGRVRAGACAFSREPSGLAGRVGWPVPPVARAIPRRRGHRCAIEISPNP